MAVANIQNIHVPKSEPFNNKQSSDKKLLKPGCSEAEFTRFKMHKSVLNKRIKSELILDLSRRFSSKCLRLFEGQTNRFPYGRHNTACVNRS